MGRGKRFSKECPICGIMFETVPSLDRKTCSPECRKVLISKINTGAGNPNYNNRWTPIQREKFSNYQKSISEIISNRVKKDWEGNETRRIEASKNMSKVMIQLFLDKPELWNKKHSEASKILIGYKSSQKFTPEYLEQQRIIMEDRGYWLPLIEKDPYQRYRDEADWIAKMWNKVDCTLLKEYGVFNSQTNSKGCVRDHMFGRINGFILKVPPIILRHPANCEVITHANNVKKAFNGDCSKTLEQLIIDIIEYTEDWVEQKECIEAIEKYLKGETSHE